MLFDGFLEPDQYILGAQRSVGMQHMALAGVFVQNCEHPQGTTTHRGIRDEVPGPDVAATRGQHRPARGNPTPHDLALGRRYSETFCST